VSGSRGSEGWERTKGGVIPCGDVGYLDKGSIIVRTFDEAAKREKRGRSRHSIGKKETKRKEMGRYIIYYGGTTSRKGKEWNEIRPRPRVSR